MVKILCPDDRMLKNLKDTIRRWDERNKPYMKYGEGESSHNQKGVCLIKDFFIFRHRHSRVWFLMYKTKMYKAPKLLNKTKVKCKK